VCGSFKQHTDIVVIIHLIMALRGLFFNGCLYPRYDDINIRTGIPRTTDVAGVAASGLGYKYSINCVVQN